MIGDSNYLIGIFDGAAVAVVAASWEGFRHFRASREDRREARLFDEGVDEIPGLIAPVAPAPLRLHNVEVEMRDVRGTLSRLTDAHVELTSAVESLNAKVGLLFENGGNTNQPGDVWARMAKRLGVYLTNEETERLRRRASDPPPASTSVVS